MDGQHEVAFYIGILWKPVLNMPVSVPVEVHGKILIAVSEGGSVAYRAEALEMQFP